MKKFLFLVCLTFAVPLIDSGCATSLAPSGAYAADTFLYNSDATFHSAYVAIDSFLKWETDNRDSLFKQNPAIKHQADNLRINAPKWSKTYFALKDGYAANPTPGNRASVQALLTDIQAAVNAAMPYLTAAATTATPNK